ncbi:PEP-CTERM sorting domain-containing protein [Luteitalea sp.]|uniref:PEP-CTERM sorting domain-containing protein n=1 Tax=Luteitalea sp. TaxID=2004800 RepID=UPI0025C51681|nr:PEP-CTERM sorting domain-containing protein [Luteitalea sp.]
MSSLVLLALLCSAAAPASATPVTLRFRGTADLAPFGASTTSRVVGDVTWDPAMPCNGNGDDYSVCRFDPEAYDGDPVPVGHLSIDGVDYSARIAPYSRLEVFPYDLFLEFWFTPPHGPGALNVGRVYLWMWSSRSEAAGTPVFYGGWLPADLAFLSRLERRALVLSGPWNETDPYLPSVSATTLFVPEPGVAALLVAGMVAAVRRRGARRR